MAMDVQAEFVSRRYRECFGASVRIDYVTWLQSGFEHAPAAALGYRRAGNAPLFLETYLDRPIEDLVSEAFDRPIERSAIVEIGNFAADNALAMVELWGSAANDLGGTSEVAVATLTTPLRRMFARIGLPIVEIAPACPDLLPDTASEWGSYYALDPMICAGVIAEGQSALTAFLAHRKRRVAA